MGKLYVGSGHGELLMKDALEKCKVGDTIYISEGFHEFGNLTFKNLTLIGQGDPKRILLRGSIASETSLTITNLSLIAATGFNGIKLFGDGAKLIAKDLWLYDADDAKYPALYAEKADVQLDNVMVRTRSKNEDLLAAFVDCPSVRLQGCKLESIYSRNSSVNADVLITRAYQADGGSKFFCTELVCESAIDRDAIRLAGDANCTILTAQLADGAGAINVTGGTLGISSLKSDADEMINCWVSSEGSLSISEGNYREVNSETGVPNKRTEFTIHNMDEYQQARKRALPGDSLYFHEGDYPLNECLDGTWNLFGVGDADKVVLHACIKMRDRHAEVVHSPSLRIENLTILANEVGNLFNFRHHQRVFLNKVIAHTSQVSSDNYPLLYGSDCELYIDDCEFTNTNPMAWEIDVVNGSAITTHNSQLGSICFTHQASVLATNATITACYLIDSCNGEFDGVTTLTTDAQDDITQLKITESSRLTIAKLVCECDSLSMRGETGFLEIPELEGRNNLAINLNISEEFETGKLSERIRPRNEKQTTSQAANDLPELADLYGMAEIKDKIAQLLRTVEINKLRAQQGGVVDKQVMHSLFLGNPGTGKTTVARIFGRELFRAGVIEEDIFVEATQDMLVSNYVGETPQKTRKVLESALGGVLFVDEAHSLAANKDATSSNAREALSTIVKFMEDHKYDLVIIFAGYSEQMQDLLAMDPGLKSRFPNTFYFEDYSPEEIADMGYQRLTSQGFKVDEAAYKRKAKASYLVTNDHSNGRWVRSFNQQLKMISGNRILDEPGADPLEITEQDLLNIDGIDEAGREERLQRALDELNSMIGLTEVKAHINKLTKTAKANKILEEAGIETRRSSMHMMFTGNPGTGKTTVARIIGEIYYALGLLSNPVPVEVNREKLVGQFVGHTERNTARYVDKALGGVLFVDEAHQLIPAGNTGNDFGKEAVNVLITAMENHRNNLVVIFAGYPDQMDRFLASDEGLISRIKTRIEFADYTVPELTEIVAALLQKTWTFDADKLAQTVQLAFEATSLDQRSNGRWARNLADEIEMAQKSYIVENISQITELTAIPNEVFDSVIPEAVEPVEQKPKFIGFQTGND